MLFSDLLWTLYSLCFLQSLVKFGKEEDGASSEFLKDLGRRKAEIREIIHCLVKIKCHNAVRLLEGGGFGEW